MTWYPCHRRRMSRCKACWRDLHPASRFPMRATSWVKTSAVLEEVGELDVAVSADFGTETLATVGNIASPAGDVNLNEVEAWPNNG